MTTPQPAKEYTNTASVAVLSIPITATDLACTVTNFLGWPTPVDGVWAIVGRGTTSAEVILITNVAGAVLSVERGQDGTVAMPHSAGDLIEHIAPAVHFSDAEEHQAAIANVHGVSGSIVGSTGPGVIRDKLYRGAFVSVHSDAEPQSITSRFESVADQPGADGYVHHNVAGDVNARAYLSDQAGVPRFEVMNDGRVKLTPSGTPGLKNTGTTELDGNVTAGANMSVAGGLTVTGALSITDLNVPGDLTVGDTLKVTGVSTLAATNTGALTATSANVNGTLGVTGTSTLAAVNASSLAATAAVSGATVSATGAVTGATVAATGAVTAYGGRAIVSTTALANITTPVTGDLAFLTTDQMLYRYTGSAWLAVLHTSATQGHARYKNTTTQSLASVSARKVYLPSAVATTTDVTITAGDVTNGSYFTLNRAGLWSIDGGVNASPTPSAINIRFVVIGDDVTYTANAFAGVYTVQGPTYGNILRVSTIRRFAAGQRIGLWFYQENTNVVTMDVAVNQEYTSLSLTWLRP